MFQKKISSNIVNDKKKQYSNENIIYSKRLQEPNNRKKRDVIKLLQEWQNKQKNKPIEVEQKYYYTEKKLIIVKPNVICKKQEKIKF